MKDLTVSPKITIKQAMKKLDQTAEKCLLVVDGGNIFFGTLTDGDIRRAILDGNKFSVSIEGCYNIKPIVFNKSDIDKIDLKAIFLKYKVDLIPVIDNKSKLVGYKTWDDVFRNGNARNNDKLEVPVVIMAGGKGTRLEPFTKVLPKPLVPINEKPIIEHIIEKFSELGCSDFYLTVNYKGRILKAYFEELSPEYSVTFINEPLPLGTAGSLKFLAGKFSAPFFVTNCDIIINSDFKELYKFHVDNKFDITLVASAKDYIIPYGTCELNDMGHLSHINEKPKYEFLINTGLYIINPEILDMIPSNVFFHITHLIESVKNTGKKVGVFPIDDEAWIDIGQWAEYRKVMDQLL
ncbi:MAG: NTP transferase domain-containing protein [Bacteroidetes bacterium]|jgi:dTDP-glucose pyrophosphorylase|nr:NTP transferase domain-containing protein [Bacteroidota bacterium]MBT4968444.1 NTP transferase domain-containing protein [Bacteroidota bacterium]